MHKLGVLYQISQTLVTVEALESYTQVASHPLHKTVKPGITSIDIHPSKDYVLTGGVDSTAIVFNCSSGEILSTLAGHTKRVRT
ncbi:unnamed protein product [Calypogeia fissa]